VLKKINYSEANKKIIDFYLTLNAKKNSADDEIYERESIHISDIKREHGLGYDDNDSSLMDFDCEEELHNIVEAILTEWFIRTFYEDYEPVFYN
jgi:hypothetical protein